MVTMSPRIRMLDRKLLRDLWAMKGQAFAIAAVMLVRTLPQRSKVCCSRGVTGTGASVVLVVSVIEPVVWIERVIVVVAYPMR